MKINAKTRLEASYRLTAGVDAEVIDLLYKVAEDVAKKKQSREFFAGTFYVILSLYGKYTGRYAIFDLTDKLGLYSSIIDIYRENPEVYGDPVRNISDFRYLLSKTLESNSNKNMSIIHVLFYETHIADELEKIAYDKFRKAMKQ